VTFLAVKNTTKIALKILHGSAVTQNTLGGLIVYNILQIFIVCQKNYKNRLTWVKVMINDNVDPFYCITFVVIFLVENHNKHVQWIKNNVVLSTTACLVFLYRHLN